MIGFETTRLVISSIISERPEPFGPPSGNGISAA